MSDKHPGRNGPNRTPDEPEAEKANTGETDPDEDDTASADGPVWLDVDGTAYGDPRRRDSPYAAGSQWLVIPAGPLYLQDGSGQDGHEGGGADGE